MDDDDGDKKKKKKNQTKYSYSFGDAYPGVIIGHKQCARFMKPGYPVPATMGWLWNASDVPGMKVNLMQSPVILHSIFDQSANRIVYYGLSILLAFVITPRKGWVPGVIGKSVAKLMTYKCARAGQEKDRKKKKRKPGQSGQTGGGDSELEEPLDPKPALKVQRKGDVFIIQVNPLKDLTELGKNEDPYVDCDPLVFKIMKKRSPEEQAKVEARKMVKMKKERDAEIRRALAEAAEDICRCAYMDVYCNDLTAIDNVIDKCPAFKEPECLCQEESLSSLSSNATWDIEYTPPFGCFDLSPRKKQVYVHVETQYTPADAGIVQPPKSKKDKEESALKGKAKLKEKRIKQNCCKRKCCGRCR